MNKDKKLRLIFYDFEVFKHDFLVVFYDYKTMRKYTVVNDAEKLKRFYSKFNDAIFIGYNNRHYDQYIFKSIVLDMNPKEVNDKLIEEKIAGYKINNKFKNIKMYNYDVALLNKSLKQLEGMMGESIEETEVDFKLDRKLTEKEIEQTIKYCTHDVEQTIKVFDATKKDFYAHLGMINEFNLTLDAFNKTKAQLSADVLGAERMHGLDDEFEYEFRPEIRLDKYKFVMDYFNDNRSYKIINEKGKEVSNKFDVIICGLKCKYGFGGVHGAVPKSVYTDGFIVHSDVNSFYPNAMIQHFLLSRACSDVEKYASILTTRMMYKRMEDARQAPYKIILNATFGICGDKNSKMFDQRRCNEITINCQLFLTDLLEKLEIEFGDTIEALNVNTDGIIMRLPNKSYYERYLKVCEEWEERCRFKLDHHEIKTIIQKDVNNYIFEFKNGDIERKGAYVKELSKLDYNLAIVNKALIDYFTKRIPVEETITNCNSLIDFQQVDKIGSTYECIMYGDKKLNGKVIRTFACTKDLPSVGKLKKDKKIKNKETGEYELKDSIEKIANTAPRCFIDNGNIIGKECPEYLDKQYYIDMANKRIDDFLGKGVRL